MHRCVTTRSRTRRPHGQFMDVDILDVFGSIQTRRDGTPRRVQNRTIRGVKPSPIGICPRANEWVQQPEGKENGPITEHERSCYYSFKNETTSWTNMGYGHERRVWTHPNSTCHGSQMASRSRIPGSQDNEMCIMGQDTNPDHGPEGPRHVHQQPATTFVVCTAVDVIHSYTIPAMGIKIPGWTRCASWNRDGTHDQIQGVHDPDTLGMVRFKMGYLRPPSPSRLPSAPPGTWAAPPGLQAGGVMTRCTSIRQQDISDRQTPKPMATSSDRRLLGSGYTPYI